MVAFLEPEQVERSARPQPPLGSRDSFTHCLNFLQTVPVGSNTRFFVSGMQATTTHFVTDKAPVEAVAPSTAKRQVPAAASDGSKRLRVGSPGAARHDAHNSSDPLDCLPDAPMHLMWVRGLRCVTCTKRGTILFCFVKSGAIVSTALALTQLTAWHQDTLANC